MGRSKGKVPNDPLISLTQRDNYATIYEGAMTHERFKKLNPTAKNLYFFCLLQRKSKKGRDNLYHFNMQYGKNYDHEKGYFTMPAKRIKEFGLDAGTCHRRAFKELIENGFIEVVENNRLSHRENIYKFTTKWKKLKD